MIRRSGDPPPIFLYPSELFGARSVDISCASRGCKKRAAFPKKSRYTPTLQRSEFQVTYWSLKQLTNTRMWSNCSSLCQMRTEHMGVLVDRALEHHIAQFASSETLLRHLFTEVAATNPLTIRW